LLINKLLGVSVAEIQAVYFGEPLTSYADIPHSFQIEGMPNR
jgi:hypothetical protein